MIGNPLRKDITCLTIRMIFYDILGVFTLGS